MIYQNLHNSSLNLHQLTKIDSFLSDSSRIFAISLLVQLNHDPLTVGRVESIQGSAMGLKLFNRSSTERVTSSNQHT